MKKYYTIICFLVCLGLLGFHFYQLDYKDLSFETNKFHYISIFAMALIGFSFLMRIIKDIKSKE